MQPDRRELISWTVNSAIALGLAGQADAQPVATEGPRPSDASRRIRQSFTSQIVMLAELTIKPDRLDEFLTYTAANLAVSRSYPGNLAFDILIDEQQPERVIFYELWRSSADQQKYMAWRTQAGDLTKLLGFLAAQPRFTQFRVIAP